MPLHRIFHAPDAFSADEKQALASRITELYVSRGLPPFYVVVLFVPVEKDSFFVGGKSTDKFVRITVDHLAAHFKDKDTKREFSEAYEALLAPSIKEKGFDWEVSITEDDPALWRLGGLSPPRPGTPAHKEWVRLNKPTPFEGASYLEGPHIK